MTLFIRQTMFLPGACQVESFVGDGLPTSRCSGREKNNSKQRKGENHVTQKKDAFNGKLGLRPVNDGFGVVWRPKLAAKSKSGADPHRGRCGYHSAL
jgi:hypothetical protein